MELVKRLGKQEAQDLLRHCIAEESFIQGRHFRDELANEKLEFDDARAVLLHGIIYNEPEWHVKHGEWNYRVEGYEEGGKWLAIVFSFKAIDNVFLITIFSVESRQKQ